MSLATPDESLELREARGVATRPRAAIPSRPTSPQCSVPIRVYLADPSATPQPITVGVPFPKGALQDSGHLRLLDEGGRSLPLQARVLARWPDDSARWILVDSILGPSGLGCRRWVLSESPPGHDGPCSPAIRVEAEGAGFVVDTGMATFTVGGQGMPLLRAVAEGREVIVPGSFRVVLTDTRGRSSTPSMTGIILEEAGPVRATLRLTGRFPGRDGCRLTARLSFVAGTGLVRLRLTVHNPKRARHPGGIWDLGDPGSVHFASLVLALQLPRHRSGRITWRSEPGDPWRSIDRGDLAIYQDSSGGENWLSRNHVNRHGLVPCRFRGYRVRAGGEEGAGLRANPTVHVEGPDGRVSVAVPEFWQQFPKAVEVRGSTVRIGLFPGQAGDPFELQGGERKRHEIWLDFGPAEGGQSLPLDWVHRPARAHVDPEWSSETGAIPYLTPAAAAFGGRLESLLAAVVDRCEGLAARREIIDEYGWRHYGEVYADHEAAHFEGAPPVVSHYNNQYDVLQGLVLQWLRSGDPRWFDLFDPLARHVIDIDIYHTTRDRAAYNGGLFWHTDHYRDAATSTHRAYSRANRKSAGRRYGGGPCAEHNYATGLLSYHYLTGDPDAREAVIALADWVVAMDDGARNLLGLIDDGPTGLASVTREPDYHGPGRGCGNSVAVLLDGWLASGRRSYLDLAAELIRRVMHPDVDVATLELSDSERRWSYTVFLSALVRYLSIKAEIGELDGDYAYGRASLLNLASWMLEREEPYLDHPEALEYPTETWAAQELRKANVMRLAAEYADDPLRAELLRRSGELAERAWSDLMQFETRRVARALAIVMIEGTRDAYLCSTRPAVAPRPTGDHDHGRPRPFTPQKRRVHAQLRTPLGIVRAMIRLADARRWRRVLRRGG